MKQVFNPYLPLYECIPDGEPHVFGDRYIFTAHTRARARTASATVITSRTPHPLTTLKAGDTRALYTGQSRTLFTTYSPIFSHPTS